MEGGNVDLSSNNGGGGGGAGSSAGGGGAGSSAGGGGAGSSAGGGGGSTPRWNPTRDQVNILENLYSQGLRTPSAEQIHHVTNRLREFGHIEGKNVFYWFQNHKARQRQKQKQESIAYMNRYLHTLPPSAPIFNSQHPNVVCSPYRVPPGAELGFYQNNPRFILPAATESSKMRPPRVDKLVHPVPRMCPNENTNQQMEDNLRTLETLNLFPLTPTGFSRGPTSPGNTSIGSSSLEHSSATEGSASRDASGDHNPYFDFFSR